MKKVLVINPPSTDKSINRDMAGGLGFSGGEGVVLAPLDLLNLAARLREVGYKVDFVDGVAERLDEIGYYTKLIQSGRFEYVVGNMSLPTLDEDIQFYRKLRLKFPKLNILVKTGINYKEILLRAIKKSKVNGIIFTECDTNIEKYLEGSENSGTILLKNKKIKFTPVNKPVTDNLDLLPIPARDLLKIDLYRYVLLPDGAATTIQTSRGCPYPCGYYCPYPLVQGQRWRSMTPERVVRELEDIKRLGFKYVLFRDATYTLDKERAAKISQLMISKKLNLKWWCETRINVLDPDLLLIMKKSGCQGINVGVETLDEDLIKREGKPGVALEDVIRIRRAAKDIGIKLHFLMIVGLPNDNLNGLSKTLDYIVSLRPESIGITSITPYPGTKLFVEASKDNLISSFDWNKFNGSNSNMRTKFLNESEIEWARKLLMAGAMFSSMNNMVGNLGIKMIKVYFYLWKKIKRQ